MTKNMIIFTIIMGWTLLIYGGITYLLVKKKEYSLISGFYNRPEEEQSFLIENGYVKAMEKLLVYTFYLHVLAFLLTLLDVPFGAEISFGLFTIVLLAGVIYIQKFEVPHKRKKYFWISGSISVGTVLFLVIIIGLDYMDNEVIIEEETFKISGMYGGEWSVDEIEEVKLLEELPKVIVRTKGMATSNLLKGNFRLEEPYGKGKLFIEKGHKPYLYVSNGDDYVIINREEAGMVEELYDQIYKGMN
ncbi:DUF3784 domain-containing protein [Salinibacillus xinjiangensis]|uniref:DUF3784 domain-containing protein n=1 Tax=Salinibacillus xinjiangensis TaxID=1229268 RepID=A0A6G1X8K6_9BACI|nr:DUF3784 domain-containing protein [Salinibacillus xinjiangensis]MRG87138.1 DUF3784 domain-containing protein [Salinibacillus xinjiangensis]